MRTAHMVFQRKEQKYRMSMAAYHKLRERLDPWLEEDEYGVYTISSIYYDTGSYQLIRASLEKPDYKEKLRLRAYGTPSEADNVYLELKKKLDGIVYKRRISLPLWEARRYLERGIRPAGDSQILREIDWFLHWYQPTPKVVLAYDRVALHSRDDSDLRITFDFRIRWRDERLDLAQGHSGRSLLSPGDCLMEIKAERAMPLWLAEALSELELVPCSFSKYGTYYRSSVLEKGGLSHAG